MEKYLSKNLLKEANYKGTQLEKGNKKARWWISYKLLFLINGILEVDCGIWGLDPDVFKFAPKKSYISDQIK